MLINPEPQVRLELEEFPNAPIHVLQMTLEDELSFGYKIQLTCDLPDLRARQPEEITRELRWGNVVITISREGTISRIEQRICGIILAAERKLSPYHFQELRQQQQLDGRELLDDVFTLTIGPAFRDLKNHTADVGSWHNRSIADLITQVLGRSLKKFGREIENRTTKNIQADEAVNAPGCSLYDWALEQMKLADIKAFFEHDGKVEKMILIDRNDDFPKGQRWQSDKPLQPRALGSAFEGISELVSSAHSIPGTSITRSPDLIGQPQIPLIGGLLGGLLGGLGGLGGMLAGSLIGGLVGTKSESKSPTLSDHYGRLRPAEMVEPAEQQHNRYVEHVRDELNAQVSAATVHHTLVGALAGRSFEFELGPGAPVREFVVVRSEMNFHRGGFRATSEVVPKTGPGGEEVNVKPTRSAREITMPGLTLARVVAVDQHPVDVAKQLRVRIRYDWDTQEGETPTTYVSVGQPMAGPFGGMQWIPREGDRVIVGFLEGKPCRPMILACLYDEENPPLHLGPPEDPDKGAALPKSAHTLGWSFASIRNGRPDLGRVTMFSAEVTADKELLFVNAPGKHRMHVENDSDTVIREGRVTHTIKKGDLVEKLEEGNYEQTINGTRHEVVEKHYTLEVKGGATFTIEGGEHGSLTTSDGPVKLTTTKTVDYTASQKIALNAPVIELNGAVGGSGGSGNTAPASVAVGSNVLIDAPRGSKTVSGPSSLTTDAESVSTSAPAVHMRDEAGGRVSLTKGTHIVEAPEGITFRCGNTLLELTPQGLVITAASVKIRTADTGPGVRSIEFDGQELLMKAGHVVMQTQRFDVVGDDPLDEGQDLPPDDTPDIPPS